MIKIQQMCNIEFLLIILELTRLISRNYLHIFFLLLEKNQQYLMKRVKIHFYILIFGVSKSVTVPHY